MAPLRIIAGLGNPGPRYAETRHNVGFMVLDGVSERLRRSDKPEDSATGWRAKRDGEIAEYRINGEAIFGVKPQTFMNRSGEVVGALMRFYKIEVPELLVVHDDIDLPVGTIRLKGGGGEGGHNGLRSVSEALGSRDYMRLRVGVGKPERIGDGPIPEGIVADYVLSRFTADERKIIESCTVKSVEAIFDLCANGLILAQTRYNG